jgi:hypothetical protein
MNIREISDVFKDTAGDIEALKSYNFGWASDRTRSTNTEDYQELNEFPRVFFSVPTIIGSDQTRKQDTYQVTLFFDDLLGYDNNGDPDLTLQLDKWAALQQYATAFIQRLNLIKQSILPNYLFIPEPPQFTFDSFVGIQRLVTVQVNFNLVVPTNCEVTVKRIIELVGNAIATGTSQANIFLSTSVSAFVECKATATGFIVTGQQNIIEVDASVTAFALASGDIVRVKNVSATTIATATAQAEVQRAVNIIGELNASGQVSGNVNLTLFVTGSATSTATVDANLEVTTQGVVECEANVTGTSVTSGSLFVIRTLEAQSVAEATSQSQIILSKLLSGVASGFAVADGNIQRVISVDSSIDTTVTTSAEAQITRVLNADATATANTEANAQLTIPVTAQATAIAESSADAQLTYSVNATATATAETTSEAQITRIISAEATATAESSAEANFGITFNAGIEATANVVNADIFRAATMDASVTGTANTISVLTLADNLAASVTGAATVTSATLDVNNPLLLDLYPNAAVAHSLRKLRTAYSGYAIRVRRSNDNTEQDIGFDSNNNLNESALTTFVGANNGFVVTWYDQSGNAKDATNATAANQPQIVSSGSVIKINNKPSLQFDGTNDTLTIPNSTSIFNFIHNGNLATIINVIKLSSSSDGGICGNNAGSSTTIGFNIDLVSSYAPYLFISRGVLGNWPVYSQYSQNSVGANQYLYYNEIDADNGTASLRGKFYINNGTPVNNSSTNPVTSNNASYDLQLGSIGNNATLLNGNFQEFIIYNDLNTSNRTPISTNINNYYAIY